MPADPRAARMSSLIGHDREAAFRRHVRCVSSPWPTQVPRPVAPRGPVAHRDARPKARFADLTGDGVQDLLAEQSPGELWSYVGGGADPFGHATPTPIDLSFDLSDPHVALADMNADGRVDVLRHDDEDGWVWLQRWDGPGLHPAEPVAPPPAGLRLGDPGVQLADMDGDRLPDLVRVLRSERRILVAPGAGLGFFEDPVDMSAVPEMSETDRWELADVTGDGAADLVRIGQADVSVWVNHLDGSYIAGGTHPWPELEADEVVLLSDVDGSGTLDILRVDTDGSQPWRFWAWGTQRPGLLEAQENGLGYRMSLRYRPAAALAAEDAAAGAPWTQTPPEAAPVLVTVAESDGLSWTRTTTYHPRHGWYDPSRGELRGFGEHEDTREGDAYCSPAITTRRYDLGQSDEARGLELLEEVTSSPAGALVRELHTVETEAPLPGVRAVRRVATDTYHVEAGPGVCGRSRADRVGPRRLGERDRGAGARPRRSRDRGRHPRRRADHYDDLRDAAHGGRAAHPHRRAGGHGRGRRADHRVTHLLRALAVHHARAGRHAGPRARPHRPRARPGHVRRHAHAASPRPPLRRPPASSPRPATTSPPRVSRWRRRLSTTT
jgi:hypothetical protein